MLLSSKIARRVAGVSLAGALFAAPAALLAGTASAAEPAATVQVDPAGTEVARPDHRDGDRPWDGQRNDRRDDHRAPETFRQFQQQFLPPTGSAL